MTDTQVHTELSEIIRGLFPKHRQAITSQTRPQDIAEWDSFKFVELILAIEERFDITLRTHDVDRVKNLGDLVSAIVRRQ